MIDGDRDGPSPEVDADTQSAITTLFLLEQQLNAARSLPGRDVVLQVMADGGGLLSCFVRVSSRDPTAAAELVLAYASWCAAGMGPSHDPRPLAVGGRPLVDIMPEGAGTSQTPVAVVRDVRILGALLQIGSGSAWVLILATLAVLMASVNIVGGFLVTRRMLAMFQKS